VARVAADVEIASWLGAAPLESPAVKLVVSLALGLFLGLEREWSQKDAGIRTFALVSVLGTAFTVYDRTAGAGADGAFLPVASAVGVVFVTMLAGGLVYGGIVSDEGKNLTTAVGLLVAYAVGLLVGVGETVPATVVAVTSSLLLVLKRELHGFAWGLSREELRSVTEFAILAFVVYPLLPAESIAVGGDVTIEPRVVWLMVVFVAGLGIVNYVIATLYGAEESPSRASSAASRPRRPSSARCETPWPSGPTSRATASRRCRSRTRRWRCETRSSSCCSPRGRTRSRRRWRPSARPSSGPWPSPP